jgi:hypothetical protein
MESGHEVQEVTTYLKFVYSHQDIGDVTFDNDHLKVDRGKLIHIKHVATKK